MRLLLASLLLMLAGCGRQPPSPEPAHLVSWRSMLADAAGMRLSSQGETRLFSSSSGSVALTGFSPQTYGDIDHGSFLSFRDIPGGVEAVLAEVDGAGAITWMNSANPVGDMVLEIDGTETVYPFSAFLSGKWLPVRSPFAARTAGGWNLHFPIIHKEHCKVSIRAKSRSELGALFYQIAWNAMDSSAVIESFDIHSINRNALKRLARLWTDPRRLGSIATCEAIASRWQDSLAFSTNGSGTIRCLEIEARSKKELAGLFIEMGWDHERGEAVACPLHLLCGVSDRFEDVDSIPVTVEGASVSIRWPMPFSESAWISLFNNGEGNAHLKTAVAVDPVCVSPYRFHANFSEHADLRTDESNVLTLLDVSGGGAIAGCMVQVENRSDAWWGEGDPIVELDGSPAWRGTGTEDYFGFAWCSETKFSHPLRGQTRTAAMYRYHLLDTLPFQNRARFEFEAHGMGAGTMDYSALVLWYSDTRSMKEWKEVK
ncbi:hypothetical protein PDESU_00747 [Pontiella desulfatans]|uniref:DUF2961 domain-containing protein n=1 Tax=Pontiella desulfatans TaxID=2750659 RepID=A0A6C2TYB9_PONDE|nr:DUF2961 domain-containing protein [Pontiella desulfatans]VGO12196.1 hypothetical protein PDESU_00747 [Pontiella desulfatans]